MEGKDGTTDSTGVGGACGVSRREGVSGKTLVEKWLVVVAVVVVVVVKEGIR